VAQHTCECDGCHSRKKTETLLMMIGLAFRTGNERLGEVAYGLPDESGAEAEEPRRSN
jgi:hypothetical protein